MVYYWPRAPNAGAEAYQQVPVPASHNRPRVAGDVR